MKSLTLEIVGGNKEDFLIFSTIKLEKGVEKTTYPSSLYFMQFNEKNILECVAQV